MSSSYDHSGERAGSVLWSN